MITSSRLAPSQGNHQCWRFISVTDEEKGETISTWERVAFAPATMEQMFS